jgi:DNA mismatch repair protein MSH6
VDSEEESDDDYDEDSDDDDDGGRKKRLRRGNSKSKTPNVRKPVPTRPPLAPVRKATPSNAVERDDTSSANLSQNTPRSDSTKGLVTPRPLAMGSGSSGKSLERFTATTSSTASSTVSTPAADTPAAPKSMPVLPEGVVGLGSHEHNFFEFLLPHKRKDKNGLRPDHPDYNPRTVLVPPQFMKDQTPAMAQWWKFKSDNMDTVLFFKVGKFYELFHMDADIGMSELELIYMKGE